MEDDRRQQYYQWQQNTSNLFPFVITADLQRTKI